MVMGGGTNGQWVRTHNEESAKAFEAEQRSQKDYGETYGGLGGRLPWVLLGVVVAVALVVFVVSLIVS